MNKMYYDYLKKEIDNMAIFYNHIKLQKAGTLFKGICPFHNEKTPSFVVYPPGHRSRNDIQDYASFYCFGCGVGGDIIKFNQLIKHLNSYQESALDLATEFKLEQPDQPQLQKTYISQIHIQEEDKPLLSIDEINLMCSRLLKRAGKQEYYKWLDDRINECDTEEAQCIIEEVINICKGK